MFHQLFSLSDLFLHIAEIATEAIPGKGDDAFTSPELNLIASQVDYLKTANDALTSSYRSLTQSFSAFTTTVNIIFSVTSVLIVIITGISGFVGFRSLKESVDSVVKTELNKAISQRIESRIDYLERVAGKESLLDDAEIGYYLPEPKVSRPPEFIALSNRFKRVKLFLNLNKKLCKSNVVILDVNNSKLSENDCIEQVKQIARKSESWVVLVVYTSNNQSPIVNHLRSSELPENEVIDYVPANTKVTLISSVVNAAYISNALELE